MAFAVAAASATLCLRMRYSFCHRKPAGVAAPMKAKRSTAMPKRRADGSLASDVPSADGLLSKTLRQHT